MVALVIGRFRRRAAEAERYAVLAEFSDTVLFEYSYADDVLELTPNARNVFALDSLRRERYLKRDLKLVDFHEDDLAEIDQVLKHPSPPGETRESTVRVRARAHRRVPLVLDHLPVFVRRFRNRTPSWGKWSTSPAARFGRAAYHALPDGWVDERSTRLLRRSGSPRRSSSMIAGCCS